MALDPSKLNGRQTGLLLLSDHFSNMLCVHYLVVLSLSLLYNILLSYLETRSTRALKRARLVSSRALRARPELRSSSRLLVTGRKRYQNNIKGGKRAPQTANIETRNGPTLANGPPKTSHAKLH